MVTYSSCIGVNGNFRDKGENLGFQTLHGFNFREWLRMAHPCTAHTAYFAVLIFTNVSQHTKIAKVNPCENYQLYGTSLGHIL